MAKNIILYAPKKHTVYNATFGNSDGTTFKQVTPNGLADGGFWVALEVSNNDTQANDLIVSIVSNNYAGTPTEVIIGVINLPVNSGWVGGTDSQKLMSKFTNYLDTYGNYIKSLEGAYLKMGMRLSISSGKTVGASITVAEY